MRPTPLCSQGIQWTPVEFFDNSIICNLIENVSCLPAPGARAGVPAPRHDFGLSTEQPQFDGAAARGRGWFGVTPSLTVQSKGGILAMLDEECLRPGVVNEDTFLTKLNQLFATHKHYESRETQNARHVMDASLLPQCFRIHHYAGKVCRHPLAPIALSPAGAAGTPPRGPLPSFAWEMRGWAGNGHGDAVCCAAPPSVAPPPCPLLSADPAPAPR